MTNREFFYAVSNMRAAQREYFKTRDQAVLRRCKALEKEIDDEIYRVKSIISLAEQVNTASW